MQCSAQKGSASTASTGCAVIRLRRRRRPAREATTPTREVAVSNVAHLLVEAVAQPGGAARHEDRCIMTIPVQQSLAGFIASDADVSFTDAGITRVHFRAGVEHWRREQDGTYTKLDNSFHDLLIFGKTAERAAARFRKGDQFVAHGYVDTQIGRAHV